MIATFTALLFAHALADFVLQTGWVHANKRRFGVLLLHGALVLGATQAALGQIAAPGILLLALAHLVIDSIKTYGRFTGPVAFLTDQAAHLVTLAALAFWGPGLWAQGFYAEHLPMPAQAPLPQMMTRNLRVLCPNSFRDPASPCTERRRIVWKWKAQRTKQSK